HTRFSRDWSSDVCSSDLDVLELLLRARLEAEVAVEQPQQVARALDVERGARVLHDLAVLLREEVRERVHRALLLRVAGPLDLVRSEDRRVGKECRCRWVA